MSKRRQSCRRMTRCVSIMRNRHYCNTVILCSQNLFLTVTRYEFISFIVTSFIVTKIELTKVVANQQLNATV